MADPGIPVEGPRGTCLPRSYFKTKLRPEGPKKSFLETAPPPLDDHPPLSQGLYPALSCTYILLMVAILLIIGQLIDRFSFSVFAPFPDLTVPVQGKHFILSLKVRGLRNFVKRN